MSDISDIIESLSKDLVSSSNAVELVGPWKHYHTTVKRVCDAYQAVREDYDKLWESHEHLKEENAANLTELREKLASFSNEQNNNMQLLDLIHHIRQQKESLEEKYYLLERDYHEQLARMESSSVEASTLSSQHYQQSEELLFVTEKFEAAQKDNAKLNEIILQREAAISSLMDKNRHLEDVNKGLEHSLVAKDRQLQLLLRERDKYRHEAEELAKKIKDKTTLKMTTPPKTQRIAETPPSIATLPTSPQDEAAFCIKEKQYLAIISRLKKELGKCSNSVR